MLDPREYKFVCIFFWGRSGSFFLHSLFDGHSDVLTIPGSLLTTYFDYFNEDDFKGNNLDTILEKFFLRFSSITDPKHEFITLFNFHKLGDETDEHLCVNKRLFKEEIKDILLDKNLNIQNFFIAVHIAYDRLVFQTVKIKKTIVFQIHQYSLTRFRKIQKYFPNIYCLHSTREPKSSFLSLIDSNLKEKNDFSFGLPGYYALIPHIFPIAEGFEHKSLCVNLEDLHNKSETTLKALFQFLDIDLQEINFRSTFAGKIWWNLSWTIKVTGFNKETTEPKRYLNLLNSFDSFRLRILFAGISEHLGYSPETSKIKKRVCFFIILPLLIYPFRFEVSYFRLIIMKVGFLTFIRNFCLEFIRAKRNLIVSAYKLNVPLFSETSYIKKL